MRGSRLNLAAKTALADRVLHMLLQMLKRLDLRGLLHRHIVNLAPMLLHNSSHIWVFRQLTFILAAEQPGASLEYLSENNNGGSSHDR